MHIWTYCCISFPPWLPDCWPACWNSEEPPCFRMVWNIPFYGYVADNIVSTVNAVVLSYLLPKLYQLHGNSVKVSVGRELTGTGSKRYPCNFNVICSGGVTPRLLLILILLIRMIQEQASCYWLCCVCSIKFKGATCNIQCAVIGYTTGNLQCNIRYS